MRHLAWLRSSEKGADETRLELRRKSGLSDTMPNIDGLEYIAEWLDELGYVNAGASGAIPLTHSDLKSWLELTDTEITGWEISVLIKLSRQYCYQSNISDSKEAEAPFKAEVTPEEIARIRKKADENIRNLF